MPDPGNTGTAAAMKVTVTDLLPQGAVLVSGGGMKVTGNGQISSMIPVLAKGAARTYTVRMRLAANQRCITNTATARAEGTGTVNAKARTCQPVRRPVTPKVTG